MPNPRLQVGARVRVHEYGRVWLGTVTNTEGWYRSFPYVVTFDEERPRDALNIFAAFELEVVAEAPSA